MRIKNTSNSYGLLSITFHWITVAAVALLFPLGLTMVDLTYYDAGYKSYPMVHKSVGMLLIGITLLRLVWNLGFTMPKSLPQPRILEIITKSVHGLLYVILLVVMISGYFISTGDGRGIDVFNWFKVPALPLKIENQADIAGNVHLYAAYFLVALIGLHGLAALKHHIIEHDNTLMRMFGKNGETKSVK